MRRLFENRAVFASVLAVILHGCVSNRPSRDPRAASLTSKNVGKSPSKQQNPSSLPVAANTRVLPDGVCPEGSEFQSSPRSCVTRGGFILGPFPIELQELCRELFPSEAGTCVQKQDWPVEFLAKFSEVLKEQCPAGTEQMPIAGCLSSGMVYGPFTLAQVGACRRKLPSHAEYQCEQMAWSEELFKSLIEPAGEEITVLNVPPPAVETKAETSEAKPDDKKPEVLTEQDDDKKTADKKTADKKTDDKKTAEGKAESKKSVADKSSAVAETKPVNTSQEMNERAVQAPTYCIYSWDERPGTADFTTQNRRLQSLRQSATYYLDRKESESLLRKKEFQNMDTCTRARFLKKCFQRVILESDSPAAQAFRAWSLGRVRPVEAHMAFVMKETRLGLWPDDCWNGRCKGVGIAKVAQARTPAGRMVIGTDPLWHGITHNIMTNLKFSLRNIAEKTKSGATDLYALAYLYNGKLRTQERYALDVDRYYKELLSCNLDER